MDAIIFSANPAMVKVDDAIRHLAEHEETVIGSHIVESISGKWSQRLLSLERPALSGSDRSHNLEGLSLVKVWFEAFQNEDHGLIFIHNKLTLIK
jgi:hypothetical protein